jgi:hypothetical protein
MKIKLQDYSLISNEFINELDELLDKFMDFSQDKVYLNVTDMKRKIYQLIPAERMYSEKEVITFLLDCRGENPIDVEKWFEQFKKK